VFAGVFHRKSDDERVDFFLAARQWSGTPQNKEPDKCDQIKWFPVDALPENVIPYVRRALENYLAGISFDEFGW
ncbi:MAG: NUDIX hydrolase, partial [Anaerolineales bacterium]|nr:NUDIX hydrolase [Anaerolineales bacterium]